MIREMSGMGRLPSANGLSRLPSANGQISRLPDTREQVNGMGRLPSDRVEHVAGGLGHLGAFGAAAAAPGAPLPIPPRSSIESRPNVAAQVQRAAAAATALARKSAQLRDQAVLALRKNERRAAGIKAVQAIQQKRKSDALAQSAIRTASVMNAERQAAGLERQAATIQSRAQSQAALTGESGATLAARARADALTREAKALRAKAALALATKPQQVGPTDARIAQVAAKFDVRTRRVEAISRADDAVLLATLQGVEDEGSTDAMLSQESAAAAYGNDALGKALTAAERGNVPMFVKVLQGVTARGSLR